MRHDCGRRDNGFGGWWLLGFGAVGVDLVGFGDWWLMGFEAVGVDLVSFFFSFFLWVIFSGSFLR